MRAIVDLGRFATVGRQRVDEVKERLVAFRQVGHLRRPVIHLGVDVERPVGAPRRTHGVVPDPLQIRREAAGARAGDQQVATVLVKQRGQAGIGLALDETREAFIGGQQVRGAG